jgi:hypothetical protein
VNRPTEFVTAEEQLRALRGDVAPKFVFNGLQVPCRIVPAAEEQQTIANALASLKIPSVHDKELFEGIAIMKATLKAAATVDGVPRFAGDFLDRLSDQELIELHEQYKRIKTSRDVRFEEMPEEHVAALVDAVKKKDTDPSALSISQLAAIGRFFLASALTKGSGPGF